MRRFLLWVLFVFAGGVFAQDSLNVHQVWSMRSHGGYTMVMDSDTNIWFVEPNTDTLVKVDVSEPESPEVVFYEMDSTMYSLYGLVNDTMLLVYAGGIYTLDIAANPPRIVSIYHSSHLTWLGEYLGDSLLVILDRANPDSCVALFNVSDPVHIDTFCTGVKAKKPFGGL